MQQMVPCVISTNTTHGTMDDVSVSSKPEWFSNITKHSFVWMASFFNFPAWCISSPAVIHPMWNTPLAAAAPGAGLECRGNVCPWWSRSSSCHPLCCTGTVALLFAQRQCQHGGTCGLLWARSLRACSSLQHQHHNLSWAPSAWEVQKGHPYTKQWCSILSIAMLENLLWRGINCSSVKFFILSLQALSSSLFGLF